MYQYLPVKNWLYLCNNVILLIQLNHMDLQNQEIVITDFAPNPRVFRIISQLGGVLGIHGTTFKENDAAVIPTPLKLPNYESVPFYLNRAQKRHLKFEANRIRNPTWSIHQEKELIKRRVKNRISATNRKINLQNF